MKEGEERDSRAEEEWKMEGEASSTVANRLPTGTGESYRGSGAKDTHHGYTFQFHLLMLYATRALNLRRKDFRIATEMASAEKFDDVIFCFPKEGEGGGRHFQFIQAKHSLNQKTREVRPSQLFDKSGGPFSLSKYFDSYVKMKRNPDLLGVCDEVQSLIICSNMGFKYGQTIGHFVFEEAILRAHNMDEILSNELLKFKNDFPGRREVVLFLKDSCVSLPKELSDAIVKGKKIDLKSFKDKNEFSSLYESYRKVLVTEVVNTHLRQFQKKFVKGHDLSPIACHFRDELWFRYLDDSAGSEKQDESMFRTFLADTVVEVSGDTSEQPKTQSVPLKALAKSMVELILENRDAKKAKINEKFPILHNNIEWLLEVVFILKGGQLVFNPGFFKSKCLPVDLNSFRASLTSRARNIDINIEEFSFEMDNVEDISVRYSGEQLDQDVKEFLEKLSFAMNQPGIAEMEATVKAEVAKFLNVSDASNAYGRFFNEMYSWAESKDARYLTEGDVRRFFVERKKEMTGGVRFNLRHPVVDFVGRDQQLRGIHEVLQGEAGVSRSQIPRAVVLCGLGGIGKSEVAREYAKKHYSSRYDNIIWIDSDNGQRLESSFKMLAFGRLGILKEDRNGDLKDIEVIVQETYEFFKDKKTLMIFDNVELNDNLSKFFPKFFLGDDGVYVLMTARSRDWKGFPIIDMDNFSSEEALEFVHLSLGHLPNWDEGEANELMKKLSNFPLALKQAVSYIEQMEKNFRSKGKSYRISDYSDLYGKSSEKLLNCPFRRELLNVYSETTYRTMMIALGHLKGSPDGRTAIPILNVMSYLSPDTIEMDVLRTAYPRFTTHQVDTSFDLLQKLSILRVEGSRVIIHRLIQSVNKINLKNLRKEEETICEAARLAEVMDVEHQMSVWESISEHRRLVMAFCQLPDKIAEQLSKKRMSGIALEFMRKAIIVLSNHLGPEHYETLISNRTIGRIYYYDGKYDEAAKVQKQNWEDHKRVLGKDNPDTFEALYHYGVTMLQLGRNKETLAIFEEIIRRGTVLFGEEHNTVMAAKHQVIELSKVLPSENAKSDEYLRKLSDWAEKVITASQEKKNNDIKSTEDCKGDERLSKVKEYSRLRTKKSGHVGGADFDDLLKAKIILAEKYEKEGNYHKAYEHYKSGLEQMEGEYVEDHGKVLILRLKMCDALIEMEKYDTALSLLDKDDLGSVSIYGKSFEHKYMELRSNALRGKDEFERQVSKKEESLKYLLQVLRLGKDNMNVLLMFERFVMAKVLEMIRGKQFETLVCILRGLYNLLKEEITVAPTFENIFAISSNLANEMFQSGHRLETVELMKYCYQYYKLVLGEVNIKTLRAKLDFARFYCIIGGRTSTLKKGKMYIVEVQKVLFEEFDNDVTEVKSLKKEISKMLELLDNKECRARGQYSKESH